MIITKELASRVAHNVSFGLVRGKGVQKRGEMCVEAAVCQALGLPHGDNPPCVGFAVRAFKISLNDSMWSSNKARGAGMRDLAIAQLGSDVIDQVKFAEIIALQTVKQIIPAVFQRLGIPGWEACRDARTLEEARAASWAAAAAASWAARAAAASWAASWAARAASWAAAAAAGRAAAAADSADSANSANCVGADEFLLLSARIALDALKELKSPGCEFL